jgi:hypothetical protein
MQKNLFPQAQSLKKNESLALLQWGKIELFYIEIEYKITRWHLLVPVENFCSLGRQNI